MTHLKPIAGVFLAASLSLAMAGSAMAQRSHNNGGDEAPAAPPPTAVTVVELKSEDLTLTSTLPGRVVASGIAEVRPQVDGIIQERMFEEGADVTVGEPLYKIDSATYEALVAAAKAQVASAQAQLTAAEREEDRLKTLLDRKVASVQNYDDALAARDAASAALAVAGAQLQSAQINLERTTIRAPLSGVIGRSLTTKGALVTNGQIEPLAVVREIDEVLVDVTQSAAEILAWRRGQLADQLKDAEDSVALTLADGSTYEHTGQLRAAEPHVNPQTGVVTLRLRFDNPERLLLPGMYVQVEMPQGVARNVVRVPQEAVSRDRRGRPVAMVVNGDNVVEARQLDVVQALQSDWVVSGGVASGERVIVEGLQKAPPGSTVAPELRQPTAPAGADETAAVAGDNKVAAN